MAFVLDASAALPWFFRDEATGRSEHLLSRADAGEQIYVAHHWSAEVLNAFTRAARRGRIDEPSADIFLTTLLSYNIVRYASTFEQEWAGALPLIHKHRLSAYDAA